MKSSGQRLGISRCISECRYSRENASFSRYSAVALGVARIMPSVQIRDNRYYIGQRTSLSHFGQGCAEDVNRLRPLIISSSADNVSDLCPFLPSH